MDSPFETKKKNHLKNVTGVETITVETFSPHVIKSVEASLKKKRFTKTFRRKNNN